MDIIDLLCLEPDHLEDPDVMADARRTGRVIISFESDFAELHYRHQHGHLGVSILRLGI